MTNAYVSASHLRLSLWLLLPKQGAASFLLFIFRRMVCIAVSYCYRNAFHSRLIIQTLLVVLKSKRPANPY